MIDVHSHILPGVDDGAATLDDSLAMLRMAAASGTTDMVATPHASPQFPYQEQKIQQAFQLLAEQAQGLINLHLGCDFHLTYGNISDALANPYKYTINHRRYLMVELPELVPLSSTGEVLIRFLRAGIIPVITHPERNDMVRNKLSELETWVDNGCLLQITGQSFLGRFGNAAKQSAESLMRAGLVHFIASDAHDCVHRPPDLSEIYRYISSYYGPPAAENTLVLNPEAALWGESLVRQTKKTSKITRLFSRARKLF